MKQASCNDSSPPVRPEDDGEAPRFRVFFNRSKKKELGKEMGRNERIYYSKALK